MCSPWKEQLPHRNRDRLLLDSEKAMVEDRRLIAWHKVLPLRVCTLFASLCSRNANELLTTPRTV